MSILRKKDWYATGGRISLLSLRGAFLLLLSSLLIGVLGFVFIEGYNVLDAFYMTIITISTVGFSEVEPLSEEGRLFTSILILINVLVLSYGLSAFTYYVIEGKIFKQLFDRTMEKKINSLTDHVILCGFGKYGKEIMQHLHQHRKDVLIIERDESKIQEIEQDGRQMLFLHGDATIDDVLVHANIEKAKVVISALPDDTDNLYITLSARQMNKNLIIISRAKEQRSQRKLELAGANHVIMPEQIGGFYMATLVTKPAATEFFTFISDEIEHDIGFAEIVYDKAPDLCRNKSIRDLNIREVTGANIIGFRDQMGSYIVNPGPDEKLIPGTSFILVGSTSQLEALEEFLDIDLDL